MDHSPARRFELEGAETAWPTVALCAAALAAQAAAAALSLAGALPAALGVLLCAVCAYTQFTVLHDSVHRGLSRRAWLNDAVGCVAGWMLFAPYDAFKRSHLHHHAHTNDPVEDPDFWAAGETWLGTALRCLTMLERHYYVYLTSLGRRDAEWDRAMGCLAFMLGVVCAGAWTGRLTALLLYWLLPAQLAVAALGFLFDYWPHRPHTQQGRMKDTAILAPRWFDPLFLSQNVHLIHHLYPTIPWYRYRACLAALEAPLRAEGALIWDLRTSLSRLRPGPLRRAA